MQNSAITTGALLFALGETANWMRWKSAEQSARNPMNIRRNSNGHLGDDFGIGGARFNEDTGKTPDSVFGKQDSSKGSFFGIEYDVSTGRALDVSLDRLVESYAGPHDFLNSWAYTDMGNNQVLSSPLNVIFSISNVVNVVNATPLVVSNIMQNYAPSLLYDEYRE